MTSGAIRNPFIAIVAISMTAASVQGIAHASEEDSSFGRVDVSTIPFDPNLLVRSATYTPSGKVLVSYADRNTDDPRYLKLAVMDDDGTNMRSFFSEKLPEREKDNGIRYMVFADNRRIFLGDFI